MSNGTPKYFAFWTSDDFDATTSVVNLLFLELELITISLDLDMFIVSLIAIKYFSIAFISE